MTTREKDLEEASKRCKTLNCEGCPLQGERWCEYAVDQYREKHK